MPPSRHIETRDSERRSAMSRKERQREGGGVWSWRVGDGVSREREPVVGGQGEGAVVGNEELRARFCRCCDCLARRVRGDFFYGAAFEGVETEQHRLHHSSHPSAKVSYSLAPVCARRPHRAEGTGSPRCLDPAPIQHLCTRNLDLFPPLLFFRARCLPTTNGLSHFVDESAL